MSTAGENSDHTLLIESFGLPCRNRFGERGGSPDVRAGVGRSIGIGGMVITALAPFDDERALDRRVLAEQAPFDLDVISSLAAQLGM